LLVARGSLFEELKRLFASTGISQIRSESFDLKAHAHTHRGSTTWKDWKMTKFRLLAVTAILSTAVATPVIAQQAVQEPGLQAFYQSLGVGSHDGAPTSAMASASARDSSYAMMAPKHIVAKPRVKHHKM
jgi:hypothetical protein